MTKHYFLYIDECGDQNLESFSPTFPIFTLCGILVAEDKVELLNQQVKELKKEFWGEKTIILHSRDIRKCQNGFEILFDLNIKQRFYEADDIIGLQIADLVAYPLTRHVLNPNQVNLAFDVIEPNIFQQDGKVVGLKVFP